MEAYLDQKEGPRPQDIDQSALIQLYQLQCAQMEEVLHYLRQLDAAVSSLAVILRKLYSALDQAADLVWSENSYG